MKGNHKIIKPIFIIGAPRSGTSILGRILENHPNLVHIREPRLIWKFGNDGKSDIMTAVDARPRVKAHIIKKFEEFISTDKQRLLEKTPSNSLRVSFMHEIFPDAKFVHIIRNGYNSVLSIRGFWENRTSDITYTRVESGESILKQRLKEMHWTQIPYYSGELFSRFANKIGIKSKVFWGPRLPGMNKLYSELELLELCALQWRFCVELACQDGRKLPPSIYKEVRLEKLTWEKVQDILSFLELSEAPEISKYYQEKFELEKVQKRRKAKNEKELETIKRYIEPTMGWLGYDI